MLPLKKLKRKKNLKPPPKKKPQRNTLCFLKRLKESLIVSIYLPCLCLFQTWTLVPLLNYRRNLQMLWRKNENQYSCWQLLSYIEHFSRDALDGVKPIFDKLNDVHQVVLHLAIVRDYCRNTHWWCLWWVLQWRCGLLENSLQPAYVAAVRQTAWSLQRSLHGVFPKEIHHLC